MGRYNIWIRNRDISKWLSIKNKSKWISKCLNERETEEKERLEKKKVVSKKLKPLIREPKVMRMEFSFCINGHSIPINRTKCMGKGCKYS